MDTPGRNSLVQARMAERHAEASRARLAKVNRWGDDRFDEIPVVRTRVRGTTGPSLLGRLIGLRPRLGGRAGVGAAAPR